MTRKEIYDYIKKNNLGKTISSSLGCNWTNVKTNLLEKWINFDNEIKESPETKQCNCVDFKKKYECLLGAVASMIISLDADVESDVKNAVSVLKGYLK